MTPYNFGDEYFDEEEYLLANPDIADAVKKDLIKSGRSHYDTYGKNENRKLRLFPSVRSVLRLYISGNGIEIGALQMPLDISGLPVTNIKYVDRLTIDELRKQYPELSDLKLVQVDIIDNGEILSKIENESLDFIIANHFIEHARNPMGTIENWLFKLRPNGIIFMAVPDKHYTFDINRELTPLQHLVSDYCSNPQERFVPDRQHFVEWATFVNNLPAEEVESRANFLMEIDYSIHFHTFTLQSFLEMLNYLRQERKLPFVLKACADTIHGSNEFLLVLMRT